MIFFCGCLFFGGVGWGGFRSFLCRWPLLRVMSASCSPELKAERSRHQRYAAAAFQIPIRARRLKTIRPPQPSDRLNRPGLDRWHRCVFASFSLKSSMINFFFLSQEKRPKHENVVSFVQCSVFHSKPEVYLSEILAPQLVCVRRNTTRLLWFNCRVLAAITGKMEGKKTNKKTSEIL